MAYDHIHASIGVRPGVPTLLALVAIKLGLGRLVLVVRDNLPHHPDCTDTEGVLEQ